MKKIVLSLFVFCLWFLWYSASLYLDSTAECPGANVVCRTGIVVTNQCVLTWDTILIPYKKIKASGNEKHRTWTVSFCLWETYWGTWSISWLWWICKADKKCCPVWSVVIRDNDTCKSCASLTADEVTRFGQSCWSWCDAAHTYTLANGAKACCQWVVDNNKCTDWLSANWITLNTECMLNGQCGLNVYKFMWIRESNENPTVVWFFQDITLASTTAILWTVVLLALIISWLMFAFASITWKDTKRAKTIMIDAFVWMLLVMWSYTIIRLIQFIATAWS